MMANLIFKDVTNNPVAKTRVFQVKNLNQEYLGGIRWKPSWRRYWFEPFAGSGFDASCLTEITTFLIQETNKQKEGWKG